MYVAYGAGQGDLEMLGLSPSDDNTAINNYKAQYGITNPCAGTEGDGPEAIDIVIEGQNFLGYPTYCIVCPDRTMYFDVCWPPTASCFDPYIEDCQDALMANFTANPLPGCVQQEVNYYDESTGNPTSWQWTFEGGTPSSSTDQNPVVIYDVAGDYDVSLEVSDGSETDLKEETDFIDVFDLPVVTLDPLDTTCLDYEPFELTGGNPPGGYYEGPGVTDNMFDPGAAGLGSHTITYYYSDGNCENYADQPIVVDICATIKENGRDAFGIYPNPSKGSITLQMNHKGLVRIVIYDLMGKVVREKEHRSNGVEKVRFDLNDQDSGLYIISVITQTSSHVEKIRIVK